MAATMPQSPRTKRPVDILQSMINGILIETGRALRTSDKEAGRSMGPANARLRSTIPLAIENFHQALDEMESDIVRAKAVLGRDLEQLRAQRFALENPATPISEEIIKTDPVIEPENPEVSVATMTVSEPSPEPVIKEEFVQTKSPQREPESTNQPIPKDLPKESIVQIPEDNKAPQAPSPPVPSDDTNSKSNILGLGIDTASAANSEVPPAPSTAEGQDSAIDSLFGDLIDGNENNNASVDLNFDDMDFAVHDSNSNVQNEEQSQTQNHEFDLSTFGDPTQGNDSALDFDMNDLQASNDTNASNTANNANDSNNANDTNEIVADKQPDVTVTDIFAMDDNTGGGENMDLDMSIDMGGGESVFDDIFFGTGEMEHGEFDNAFFGLED